MGFFKNLSSITDSINKSIMDTAQGMVDGHAGRPFNNSNSDRAGSPVPPPSPAGGIRQTPPPPPPSFQETLSVFVSQNGQQYGPYDRQSLEKMIKQGTLTLDTYVFAEGMTEWKHARDVAGVQALFGNPQAAPAPPMPFAVPQAPADNQSSNGMSAKLNNLVEAAIADGSITDLERQVLIRNAQQEGISVDEFCVMVDARLFEKQQELKAREDAKNVKIAQANASAAAASAARPAAPKKSEKLGGLRRCPACNAVINSVSASKCPECGYEFSTSAEARCTVNQLLKELKQIEASHKPVNTWKSAFTDEPDLDEKKASCIENFGIPDNKIDMLEFLAIGVPLGKKPGFFSDEVDDEVRVAWRKNASRLS